MKRVHLKNYLIVSSSMILIYLLISLYFTKHYLFNTVINGVNVSLKIHGETENIINHYIKNYELRLVDKNGDSEILSGQDMGLSYNDKYSKKILYRIQNPILWIISVFKKKNYNVRNLYHYDDTRVESLINHLACLNKVCIKSKNVSFMYSNGVYDAIPEVYGNMINNKVLKEEVRIAILQGKNELDLRNEKCYINPRFTLNSAKTKETWNLLNQYVSAKIIYQFGNRNESLDADIIHQWLLIDDDFNVIIDETAVLNYVVGLCSKYDTVGTAREFSTSLNKTVEVKGGYYGWKINKEEEIKALIEYIKSGKKIEREPIYAQTALARGDNDIGDTYVEINITRQYLWFYKEGKLFLEGPIVTGNPSRGNSTMLGVHRIMYKQSKATLAGANYEVKVAFWMPFYANMGIHDARWRHSFGGEIYKRNGTHGCVNVPYSMAKRLYENVEEGIPVICYEE